MSFVAARWPIFAASPLAARRDPDDCKSMKTIGPGVREIRIKGKDGAFRVIYVATFPDAVFVLHCFQKKSQRTSRGDLALATRRYKDLVMELKP